MKKYRIYSQGRDTRLVVSAQDDEEAVIIAKRAYPSYLGWPSKLTARLLRNEEGEMNDKMQGLIEELDNIMTQEFDGFTGIYADLDEDDKEFTRGAWQRIIADIARAIIKTGELDEMLGIVGRWSAAEGKEACISWLTRMADDPDVGFLPNLIALSPAGRPEEKE